MNSAITDEELDQLLQAGLLEDGMLERLVETSRTGEPLTELEARRLQQAWTLLEAQKRIPAWVLDEDNLQPPTEGELEELLAWSSQIPVDAHNEALCRKEMLEQWEKAFGQNATPVQLPEQPPLAQTNERAPSDAPSVQQVTPQTATTGNATASHHSRVWERARATNNTLWFRIASAAAGLAAILLGFFLLNEPTDSSRGIGPVVPTLEERCKGGNAQACDEEGTRLYQQGGFAGARPLLERSLTLRRATLGESHPLIATSLTNLALLYQATGQYALALPLFEQALAINKASLGDNHPDTVQSLNNLSALHQVMEQ